MLSNVQEEVRWITQLASTSQQMFQLLDAVEQRKESIYSQYDLQHNDELKKNNERALQIISLIKNKTFLATGELEKHRKSLQKSLGMVRELAEQANISKKEVKKTLYGVLETASELDTILRASADYLDAAEYEYEKERHIIELLPKSLPDCKFALKVRKHHKKILQHKLHHTPIVRQGILNVKQTPLIQHCLQAQQMEAIHCSPKGEHWDVHELKTGLVLIVELMVELCTVIVHEFVFVQEKEEE